MDNTVMKTTEKRGFIYNYLTSGLDAEERLLYRVRLINLFSLVGVSSLVAFGSYRLLLGDCVGGAIELFVAGVGIVNIFALRRFANISIATTTILFFTLMILLYLVVDGGIRGTGLFWLYVYPVLAFFLKEKSEAWGWIIILYVLVAGGVAAKLFGFLEIPFEVFTLTQAMTSLFAVTLLVYFYALIDEKNNLLLKNKAREIALFNEKLVGEVFKREDGK